MSRHFLDVAKFGLTAVQKTYGFGIELAKLTSSFLFGGLLDIKKAKFDIRLSVAKGGHFRISMTAVFLRKYRRTFSLNINIRSLSSIVKSLVAKIKSFFKLGRVFGKRNIPRPRKRFVFDLVKCIRNG